MMDELMTSPDEQFGRARVAFDAGDFHAALAILRHLPPTPERVALARDCSLQLGELSAALGQLGRLRRLRDDERSRRQARFLLGRLRETDPTWLPALREPSREVDTSGSGVVLHLLKESLPYSQTGYTFRSRMTLEAQRRAGLDPAVVTSLGFPAYKGEEGVPALEEVDGVRHHRLDLEAETRLPVKQLPFDIVLTEQVNRTARIVEEERPALIQAGSGFRGYDQALVGLALARRYRLPFVYEVRGFLEATWSARTDLQEAGEYFHLRQRQDERVMRAADLVITIAGSMRDVLVDRGIDPGSIHVVPNAVDVDRFQPRAKDAALRAELGLGDRFVVGYITNLGRREGLVHLLRTTAALIADGREVACLVVGDGPERGELERLVEELGLQGCAVLTGHVPNERIEDHYALIDAFVVPRIDDQAARLVTPLKPLEAMAMSIPVIASDLPALREIVAPGERGLVFAPGDEAELAAHIGRLMDDPSLGRSLAETARSWVLSERTLASNASRYREALGALL